MAAQKHIACFVVDFNLDSTELTEPLLEDAATAIRDGHRQLYHSTGFVHRHAPIAKKNTAHLLPDRSYGVLCNVGGDNVLTVEFVEQCLCVACRSKSGEVGRAQFHSHLQRGAYGRIMFARTLFHKLAGCDEEIYPAGAQDTDLTHRVLACENAGNATNVDNKRWVGVSILNKPGTF